MNPTHTYAAAGNYMVKATIVINGYPVILYKETEAYAMPQLDPGQTLLQCDPDNDGISTFNLLNIADKMNNPDNIEYDFTFYNTYEDVIDHSNAVTNTELYENTSNPQKLYVEIVSPEGCSTISDFFIESTYTQLDALEGIVTCEDSDDVLNNGEGLFNLLAKDREIRDQYGIPLTSRISYYKTFEDAQTKIDPLPFYYKATSTTIWVRIENDDFSCYGVQPIELIVNSPLEFNIDSDYTICNTNTNSSIVLESSISNSKWEWKDSVGNLISTDRIVEIAEEGEFSLTVYRTENDLECSLTKQFTVSKSASPVFTEVNARDGQVSVSVEGESTYKFALDNNPFTGDGDSHIFDQVPPGIYTINVRDKNKCEGSIAMQVSLLGFPDFFTPNADGYNDVWKIYGVNKDFYKYASISIFDRFGKNLFNMDLESNPNGWDGTFNGSKLYATDYWYSATLIDLEGKETHKTGHFSMIY